MKSQFITFCLFIAAWISMWLLIAALTFIASPGSSYREVLGYGGVMLFSGFLGWVPGVFIATDRHGAEVK